jgi:4-hydroxy-tetrahydrodipicolinate synthase
MQFNGIYVPVITPFNDDFSINEKGFSSIVDGAIAAGVQGVIVGGTTGEYYAMEKSERLLTFAIAKEAVAGRVPMITGIGALRTEDAIDLAKSAYKAGADCLLLGAPYYAIPTSEELVRHCLAVERATDLPIMLYNFPDRTGAPMDEACLERLSMRPNFCAIKESSGDINRVHLLARRFPHIQLSCGMDDQALEFFAWGAQSWVAGAANFLPKEHYALYHACVVEQDFVKGRKIMTALLPLMQTLEQGGKFVQCIKYGCQLEGIVTGPVRKPLRDMSIELKREFEVTVQTVKTTIASICNNFTEA